MVRAAVVGCGLIAQVHGRALKALKDVELAACADVKMERAEKYQADFGPTPYPSLEKMLDAEKIDVLHVCTPHYLHVPMILEAAKRKIAVFTEKPPAIARAQWALLTSAAEKIPIGVCFQNRFNPPVEYLKRAIGKGAFGRFLGARAFVTWKREAPYYTESGWRGAWATEGGGVLINQSIHTLDLLIYLLGRPADVEARLSNHHLKGVIEVEDTIEARMTFVGAPALFYATTAYCEDSAVLIDFRFEKARVRMENGLLIEWADGRIERPAFEEPEALGKGYWGNGHLTCIEEFYRTLGAGERFRNDLPGVEDTVEAMLSIYESRPEIVK